MRCVRFARYCGQMYRRHLFSYGGLEFVFFFAFCSFIGFIVLEVPVPVVARLLARWASKCPLDAYFCAKINIAVLRLKNFLAKSSNKFAVKTAEIHFTPWMVKFCPQWSQVL